MFFAGKNPHFEKMANILVVVGVLTSFYTGFKLPSLWSQNYFIPSIFEGFYRRSFAGSLLYPFGDLRFSYYFIATVQGCIFLIFLVCLLKNIFSSDAKLKFVAALFLGGSFGAFFFQSSGYIDYLLYLSLMLCLLIKNRVFSLLILSMSILTHEISVFTIIPVYLAHRIHVSENRIKIMIDATLLFAVFAVIFIFGQTVDEKIVLQFLNELSSKVNYSMYLDYYDIFLNSFLGERQKFYYKKPDIARIWFVCLLAVAASYIAIRDDMAPSRKFIVAGATLLACLAPLVNGFFGWDTSRWLVLSGLSSAFFVWLYRENMTPHKTKILTLALLPFIYPIQFLFFEGLKPRTLSVDGLQQFLLELPTLLTTIPAY